MKKLIVLLVLMLGVYAAHGQTFKTYSCNASGCVPNNNASGLNVTLTSNISYTLSWSVTGSPTCAVAVDSSTNGITWSAGGIIGSQNCGSNGSASSTTLAHWIRVMPTISGSGTVTFKLQGFSSTSSSIPAPTSLGTCFVASSLTVPPYGNWSSCSGSASTNWSGLVADAPMTSGTFQVSTGASIVPINSGVIQATAAPWAGLTGTAPSVSVNGTACQIGGTCTPSTPVGQISGTFVSGDNGLATGAFATISNYLTTATASSTYLTIASAASTYEPALGNPLTNGYVLSSTTGGTRSWVANGGAWSALSNPTTSLTLSMGTYNTSFNQTGPVAWLWHNTTVATSGTTNQSPVLNLEANYWNGSASATDDWAISSSLGFGTNAATTLNIVHGSGSTGAANVAVPGLICGTLNTVSCVLTGYGSASGTATITWPATAGTTTNPIVFSNAIQLPGLTTNGVLYAAAGVPTSTAAGAADSVFMGNSAGAGSAPGFVAGPGNCSSSANAVTYDTTAHAWGCNTLSGSGTVNTGVAAQLAYYATSTNVVSGNFNATISGGVLTIGQANTALGSLVLEGATSGALTIVTQANAGTPTWTAGTNSGTPAVSASSPLSLATATGNLTCATCVTSAASLTANALVIGGGGQATSTIAADTTTTHALFATATGPAFRAIGTGDLPSQIPIANVGTAGLSGTSPVAISAAGAISLSGATGQVPNGASGAFTGTPQLGAAGTLGSVTFGNATSGLLTLEPVTGALGTVTVYLPAGGTLAALTGTAHGLKISQGTSSAETSTAVGGLNFPLIGQGAGNDPVFSTIAHPSSLTSGGLVYASSSTAMSGSTAGTTHGVWLAQGAGNAPTSTAAGTSGYPLVSGGASADPSYAQLASAGLNITATGCTNQVITTISSGGVGTCTGLSSTYLPLSAMGTITGGTWNGTVVAQGYGGTGVANTASLTLGTANHNYASLGTGIIKNTTTTGAFTVATAADVDSLYTGSGKCYLFKGTSPGSNDGCDSPSGAGNVSASGSQAQYQVGVWGTGTTLAGIGPGTTGQPFLSGGASANPGYNALNLAGGSSIVTGTLPNTNLPLSAMGTITGGTWQASVVGVQYGGTGSASLNAHSVLLGEGTSAMGTVSVGGTGSVLIGTSAADPSFSANLVLGSTVLGTGTLAIAGGSSGTITIQPQAAAGTYNFNLPTSAGSAGQALLSAGGGASAMTFGTLGAAAGGTGVANNAANTITFTGSYSLGLTLTGATSVTLPTSGTLATTSQIPSTVTINSTSCTLGSSCTPPVSTTGGSSSSSTFYPTFVSSNTSGNYAPTTTSALSFVPSTGVLSTTGLAASNIVLNAATGGSEGSGTINVSGGYYVNGVALGGGNFSATITSPATGQYVTYNGSAWVNATPGVSIDKQTGTSYTIPASDNVTLLRGSNTLATAWAGTNMLANNYAWKAMNINSGLITYTPASGVIYPGGGSTQIIPQNWFAEVYTDNSDTYMGVLPMIKAFADTSAGGLALTFNQTTGAFGTIAVGASGAFPQTVSGTTTQYHFPYFATTTSLANDTLLSDNGTTLAYTGTGGVAAPSFTANGSGAGFLQLGQGSAQSPGTTSILVQAPTSVTAYAITLPGAQPTSGNTYFSCTAANPAVCSWVAGGGSGMVWPSTAGIPYWTSGTSWGGAYNSSTNIPANYLPSALSSSSSVNGTTIPSSVTLAYLSAAAQTFTNGITAPTLTTGAAPTGTFGTGFALIGTEGTAPSGLASTGHALYWNASSHCLDWIYHSTDEGCLVTTSTAVAVGSIPGGTTTNTTGLYSTNQTVWWMIVPFAGGLTIPVNGTSAGGTSYFNFGVPNAVPPAVGEVLTIYDNSTSIGTITCGANTSACTFAIASPYTVPLGHTLSYQAQSSPDGSAAGGGGSLYFTH